MLQITRSLLVGSLAALACSCSNDDSGNGSDAVRKGVGAECSLDTDCVTKGSVCLTQFKAGYCGLSNCSSDTECPEGSLCVTHDDGANYCFLTCSNKSDCNLGRSLDNESNCVANITYVNATNQSKACVPPSGG